MASSAEGPACVLLLAPHPQRPPDLGRDNDPTRPGNRSKVQFQCLQKLSIRTLLVDAFIPRHESVDAVRPLDHQRRATYRTSLTLATSSAKRSRNSLLSLSSLEWNSWCTATESASSAASRPSSPSVAPQTGKPPVVACYFSAVGALHRRKARSWRTADIPISSTCSTVSGSG